MSGGPGITASYTYNGLDTRVGKTENGVSHTYKRDGVYVTDAVLSDSSAFYTPGVSEKRAGVTSYLHGGLKNQTRQTNSSQNVTSSRTYDAFGNVTSSSGTWNGPFGNAGAFGYQEDATGLKLLGHRYYDSSLGRFLTRDPVKDGRNWYAYCGNDPVNKVDPSGLTTATFGPGALAFSLLMTEIFVAGMAAYVFYGVSVLIKHVTATRAETDIGNTLISPSPSPSPSPSRPGWRPGGTSTDPERRRRNEITVYRIGSARRNGGLGRFWSRKNPAEHPEFLIEQGMGDWLMPKDAPWVIWAGEVDLNDPGVIEGPAMTPDRKPIGNGWTEFEIPEWETKVRRRRSSPTSPSDYFPSPYWP